MIYKAKYATPCIHCGYCCRASLCPAAEQAFPGAVAPCPGIFVESVNTFCGLVMMEKIASEVGKIEPIVSKMLGIGCGCSCPDEDTSEDQMEQFDKLSHIRMYGA